MNWDKKTQFNTDGKKKTGTHDVPAIGFYLATKINGVSQDVLFPFWFVREVHHGDALFSF